MPLDLLRTVREVVPGGTVAFVAAVAFVFALGGGFLGWIVDRTYRHALDREAAQRAASAPATDAKSSLAEFPASPPQMEPPPKEPALSKDEPPKQLSTGPNSPNVTQGPGSIAQFGSNNQATINNAPPPWELNNEQRAAIASVARSHQHLWQKDVDMMTAVMGDAESLRMADSFLLALREGGWQLAGYAHSGYMQAPEGIFAAISEADKENRAVVSFLMDFSAVLRTTGLLKGDMPVHFVDLPRGRVEIRIGRRPRIGG